MLWNNTPVHIRPEILKAVGAPENLSGSFYPQTFPNLEATTESDFWGYHAHYSFNSDSIYLGRMTLFGVTGTARLFYISDGGRRGPGGFVVLTQYDEGGNYKVHYFKWIVCHHEFERQNIGNCLNRYTCKKCGSAHDVDSSG